MTYDPYVRDNNYPATQQGRKAAKGAIGGLADAKIKRETDKLQLLVDEFYENGFLTSNELYELTTKFDDVRENVRQIHGILGLDN